MPNLIDCQIGFNRVAATTRSPLFGGGGGGQAVLDPLNTLPIGAAVILPNPGSRTQQIDAISFGYGTPVNNQGALGVRIAVLVGATSVDGMLAALLALPNLVAAVEVATSLPTPNLGQLLIPDLSTLLSADPNFPSRASSPSWIAALDMPMYAQGGSGSIAPLQCGPIQISSRPGGGILIPPGSTAAVLCVTLLPFDGTSVVTEEIFGGVQVAAHGGTLPQWYDDSMSQGGVGPARFDNLEVLQG